MAWAALCLLVAACGHASPPPPLLDAARATGLAIAVDRARDQAFGGGPAGALLRLASPSLRRRIQAQLTAFAQRDLLIDESPVVERLVYRRPTPGQEDLILFVQSCIHVGGRPCITSDRETFMRFRYQSRHWLLVSSHDLQPRQWH